MKDPRHYQIAVLAALVLYGTLGLGFAIDPARIAAILGGALATQAVAGRLAGLRGFDARSPLITGLGLCMLLRTNSLGLDLLAGVLAIAGKFLIRYRGKHVFNPSALAIVVLAMATEGAWLSPGQWGNTAWFGFLLASAGGLVVHRSRRSDVTLAFLAFWAGLLLLRAAWLGDPWAIPLHQLQTGSLVLFAFFMISDPKTTPDSRAGRILFALLVALGAAFVQFGLFRQNGPVLALVAFSPVVPLIDRWIPGERYRWDAPAGPASPANHPCPRPPRGWTEAPASSGALS